MAPVKKTFFFSFFLLLAASIYGQGQASTDMQTPPDSIQLKTLKGGMVSYGSLARKNPVILVCFWSVNNEASINELNAISAQYERWKQRATFTLMAISVDEGNLVNRMRPMANQNGWAFDVYADISGELQRLLNYSNVPQAMVLDKGQVVYQQAGFSAGSENYLFNKVLALAPAPIKK